MALVSPFLRPLASTLVMGVGGCGARVISALAAEAQGDLLNDLDNPVDVVMVGTDARDIAASGASRQLLLGAERTRGRGTLGDPALGREAALEERDRISDLVGSADLCLLAAGLGKGTGGGALPVVAERARRRGALTVAVVNLPGPEEGPLVCARAEQALEALRPFVCVLVTTRTGPSPRTGTLHIHSAGPVGPPWLGPPAGDWPIGVRCGQPAGAPMTALKVLTLHGCTVAVEAVPGETGPTGPFLIREEAAGGAMDAARQTKTAWEHLGLEGQAVADFSVDERGHAWLLQLQALESTGSSPAWSVGQGQEAASAHRLAGALSRRLGPLTRALLRAMARTAAPDRET